MLRKIQTLKFKIVIFFLPWLYIETIKCINFINSVLNRSVLHIVEEKVLNVYKIMYDF